MKMGNMRSQIRLRKEKDLKYRYIGKVWLAKLEFSIATEYNYVFSCGQPWIRNNKELRMEFMKSTVLLQTYVSQIFVISVLLDNLK